MSDPYPTSHHWLIFVSGGHGRCVDDAIRVNGDAVLSFLNDGRRADELVTGSHVLGSMHLALDVIIPFSDGSPP